LQPGQKNSGIWIERIDLPGGPRVKAVASNVVDVQRATTLRSGEAQVHTVEHVLAALYAAGVDNAVLAMDGPEPPIADGSSRPYVDMIRELGVMEQDAPRKYLVVTEPVFVEQGGSKIVVVPD